MKVGGGLGAAFGDRLAGHLHHGFGVADLGLRAAVALQPALGAPVLGTYLGGPGLSDQKSGCCMRVSSPPTCFSSEAGSKVITEPLELPLDLGEAAPRVRRWYGCWSVLVMTATS